MIQSPRLPKYPPTTADGAGSPLSGGVRPRMRPYDSVGNRRLWGADWVAACDRGAEVCPVCGLEAITDEPGAVSYCAGAIVWGTAHERTRMVRR